MGDAVTDYRDEEARRRLDEGRRFRALSTALITIPGGVIALIARWGDLEGMMLAASLVAFGIGYLVLADRTRRESQ